MVDLAAGSLVCTTATLEGDVTIGARTVVHPLSRILARSGPIFIGEENIIEERVEIINDGEKDAVMIVGNGNLFEVGCVSRSRKIGNSNVVEARAVVGREAVLSFQCVVGAGCELDSRETLGPGTVLTAGLRRVGSGSNPGPAGQRDLLARLLPNYHAFRQTDEEEEGGGGGGDGGASSVPGAGAELESEKPRTVRSTVRTFNKIRSLIRK